MNSSFFPNAVQGDDFWLDHPQHRAWLLEDAERQFVFFRQSLNPDGGFHTLDWHGTPRKDALQELHATTRMVHSFALARLLGVSGAEQVIDHGMKLLIEGHRDGQHGGYLWSLREGRCVDDRKLAYGHVFVLLAASSAYATGHSEAKNLLDNVAQVLDERFWEEEHGLFADEFNRDWTPFSTYRGMNANMHAVEALLAAFEVTGQEIFLTRARRILSFFIDKMAPAYGWRLPEHYTARWQIDADYEGNPMFRPAGTTPGHSFELGRLLLQFWDLSGRPQDGSAQKARRLIETALADGWDAQRGGIIYTLAADGRVLRPDRYWWPVTEAIGAMAALIKLDRRPQDEEWYRRLWTFAAMNLVDTAQGGWFLELDANNRPTQKQFQGKADIYHSIQAVLYPLTRGLSHPLRDLQMRGKEGLAQA